MNLLDLNNIDLSCITPPLLSSYSNEDLINNAKESLPPFNIPCHSQNVESLVADITVSRQAVGHEKRHKNSSTPWSPERIFQKNTGKNISLKTNTKWQSRIPMNSREGGNEGLLKKVKVKKNLSRSPHLRLEPSGRTHILKFAIRTNTTVSFRLSRSGSHGQLEVFRRDQV